MINVFTLTRGLTNLTSGTHTGCNIIHCVEDATVEINWDGTTDSISMLAGEDFMVVPSYATGGETSITISSGKVHLTRG